MRRRNASRCSALSSTKGLYVSSAAELLLSAEESLNVRDDFFWIANIKLFQSAEQKFATAREKFRGHFTDKPSLLNETGELNELLSHLSTDLEQGEVALLLEFLVVQATCRGELDPDAVLDGLRGETAARAACDRSYCFLSFWLPEHLLGRGEVRLREGVVGEVLRLELEVLEDPEADFAEPTLTKVFDRHVEAGVALLEQRLHRGCWRSAGERRDIRLLQLIESCSRPALPLQKAHCLHDVEASWRDHMEGHKVFAGVVDRPYLAGEDRLVGKDIRALGDREHRSVREEQLVNVEVEDIRDDILPCLGLLAHTEAVETVAPEVADYAVRPAAREPVVNGAQNCCGRLVVGDDDVFLDTVASGVETDMRLP